MARAAKQSFVCQNCGATSPRWVGKCPGCGEWNTPRRGNRRRPAPRQRHRRRKGRKGAVVHLEGLTGNTAEAPRLATGLAELDRVTGGGIVPGSAILIGGEPGIGKSTLLLQLAAALARAGRRALYFSGEEATAQVRLRAERLGLTDAPVALASETNLANILATAADGERPDLIIIDSIQTLWSDTLDAAPGTVSQMRASTQGLIRFAKQAGSALILVGHVTKEGQIAGPKVIEHMVDTVLYFEGDRGNPFRLLRAIKNRFGATDEIGVFEMADDGLQEVANPSELFPRRSRRRSPRRRRLRRHRGNPPGSRRDPGPGRPIRPRHAAPRCRRLGFEPPVDGARRARCPLRRLTSQPTTSTSTSQAASKSPNQPPIWPPPQPSCRRFPAPRCRKIMSISAKSACPAPSARPPTWQTDCAKPRSLALKQPCCRQPVRSRKRPPASSSTVLNTSNNLRTR